jgi:hypothetical protein
MKGVLAALMVNDVFTVGNPLLRIAHVTTLTETTARMTTLQRHGKGRRRNESTGADVIVT